MLLMGIDEDVSSGRDTKKKTEGEGERSYNNETLLFLLPPLRATAPFDPFLGLSSRPRWNKMTENCSTV